MTCESEGESGFAVRSPRLQSPRSSHPSLGLPPLAASHISPQTLQHREHDTSLGRRGEALARNVFENSSDLTTQVCKLQFHFKSARAFYSLCSSNNVVLF